MLNSALQLAPYASAFAADRRVQIHDILQPEAAEAIHQCLHKDVPWTLAYKQGDAAKTLSHSDLQSMPRAQFQCLRSQVLDQARTDFQFQYLSYMMVSAYIEQRDPELLLNRIVEYLNGPEFLDFARQLTGFSEIKKADCQATCYRAGHFLKHHNDDDATQERLVAYVLSLTRNWSADCGGLLHFLDRSGRVEQTYMPQFNCLTLFAVPADHCVSYVSEFATGSRYSITGWLRKT